MFVGGSLNVSNCSNSWVKIMYHSTLLYSPQVYSHLNNLGHCYIIFQQPNTSHTKALNSPKEMVQEYSATQPVQLVSQPKSGAIIYLSIVLKTKTVISPGVISYKKTTIN